MNFQFAKTALSTIVGLGLASSVVAATVTPISAVGSSSYPGFNDYFAVDTGANSAVTDWSSFGQGTASYLNLDLGAVYTLASAAVTDRVTSGGGNGSFLGGTGDFTTQYSLTAYTDATFTTVVGSSVIVNHATPVAPSSPADFTSTANLSGLNAQYVRYNVLAANGGNVGLSNISFNTVPEPASWALLIVGFGMVGAATRRRSAAFAA